MLAGFALPYLQVDDLANGPLQSSAIVTLFAKAPDFRRPSFSE
jgi:hypothetical protein